VSNNLLYGFKAPGVAAAPPGARPAPGRAVAHVSAPLGTARAARARERKASGMRRDCTVQIKEVPPAGALGLRDGPGPAGDRGFVVGVVRGAPIPTAIGPGKPSSRGPGVQEAPIDRQVVCLRCNGGTFVLVRCL